MAKEEKKPQTELQKKLEADGWKVSKIEEANGCYEVHATDGKGAEVEAFLNSGLQLVLEEPETTAYWANGGRACRVCQRE